MLYVGQNAVRMLNQANDGLDASATLQAVRHPMFGLLSVQENVKSLYHEELRLIKC